MKLYFRKEKEKRYTNLLFSKFVLQADDNCDNVEGKLKKYI